MEGIREIIMGGTVVEAAMVGDYGKGKVQGRVTAMVVEGRWIIMIHR